MQQKENGMCKYNTRSESEIIICNTHFAIGLLDYCHHVSDPQNGRN